jgi:hypothetical protein
VSEEGWHEARLIPTSGISGAEEQERRATSALLAVLSAVKEFGRVVTGRLGAPAGHVATYTEVPFVLGERRLYPDGVIRVTRGSRSWTCLVEVKTGTNELQAEQLDAYLDIAREQGFDALLTISNEIPPSADLHPTKVDRRKLKKVALHHLAWTQILADAVMQKEFRGVADPDQAWILGELIRYLEHPKSGALEFEDMGAGWVTVRDAVAAGTLRANDKAAPEIAARFEAFTRYIALRLGRQLGTDVSLVLSRKDAADPAGKTAALVQSLTGSGTLAGAVRIPNTIGDLNLVMDLRTGRITCYVDVEAPREGKQLTRVNWLIRQLKDAPDNVRIEAFTAYARGAGTAALLRDVRINPAVLIADPTKEIRTFRLALSMPLGAKRGRGRGTAIDSTLEAVDLFYAEVLGRLKAWTAAPPKLREELVEQPIVDPDLASTGFCSQGETLAELTDLDGAPAGQREESEPLGVLVPAPRPEIDDVPDAWREHREDSAREGSDQDEPARAIMDEQHGEPGPEIDEDPASGPGVADLERITEGAGDDPIKRLTFGLWSGLNR